jgi:hypothetical protein
MNQPTIPPDLHVTAAVQWTHINATPIADMRLIIWTARERYGIDTKQIIIHPRAIADARKTCEVISTFKYYCIVPPDDEYGVHVVANGLGLILGAHVMPAKTKPPETVFFYDSNIVNIAELRIA